MIAESRWAVLCRCITGGKWLFSCDITKLQKSQVHFLVSVSKYRLCAFLHIQGSLILLQYSYKSKTCIKTNTCKRQFIPQGTFKEDYMWCCYDQSFIILYLRTPAISSVPLIIVAFRLVLQLLCSLLDRQQTCCCSVTVSKAALTDYETHGVAFYYHPMSK